MQAAPLLLFFGLLATRVGAAAPELHTDTDVATAGYFRLSWTAAEPVQLVEASSASFADGRVIYAGADRARVMSGKDDGEWYYRLESADSAQPLTEPLRVTVRHHSLERAWFFFGVGAFVFIATGILIGMGSRQAAQGQKA